MKRRNGNDIRENGKISRPVAMYVKEPPKAVKRKQGSGGG